MQVSKVGFKNPDLIPKVRGEQFFWYCFTKFEETFGEKLFLF